MARTFNEYHVPIVEAYQSINSTHRKEGKMKKHLQALIHQGRVRVRQDLHQVYHDKQTAMIEKLLLMNMHFIPQEIRVTYRLRHDCVLPECSFQEDFCMRFWISIIHIRLSIDFRLLHSATWWETMRKRPVGPPLP